MYEIGEKTETILSSLQACFVITHSSGDFIVKSIHNHHLYNLQTCISLFLCWHEDTCSLRLLSDDNSGWQMISNFSLREVVSFACVVVG